MKGPIITKNNGHGHSLAVPRGRLAATCWCETYIVAVPDVDVRAGKTLSCGLPNCEPSSLLGIA